MPMKSPWILATALLLAAQPALAADAKADKAIKDFLAAYDKVQSYHGKIAVYTNAKGKHVESKYELALQKPHHTMFTMVENPSLRLAEGTKIVWHGGSTVDVRTKFFGFPMKLNVKYDDPRLVGARGDNMWDLSVAKAVQITKDPGAKFKYLRTETFLGRPMDVLEIHSPAMLKGIDHEVLWLDQQLHLPFKRDMYSNGQVAYHVEVETFQFDQKLGPDTFRVE
jgi:outer membrane lipoprotein-sorting protein